MSDAHRPAPLKIEVETRASAAIARMVGSASMDVPFNLRDRLVEIVDKQNANLILDLSDLEFISSLGLGAIVAAHLRSRHHKGTVRLVNPQPAIQDVLEVTKLDRLFNVFPTVDAALADIQSSPSS